MSTNWRPCWYLCCLMTVSLTLSATANAGEGPQRLVKIPIGNAGRMLNRELQEDDLSGVLAETPPKMKRALVAELSKHANISVVERLRGSDEDGRQFDPKWTPRPSIDGSTTGIVRAEAQGDDSDLCYTLHVELKDIDLERDAQKRWFLLCITLDFHGPGLRFDPEGLGRAGNLLWQLDTKVTVERAVAELNRQPPKDPMGD